MRTRNFDVSTRGSWLRNSCFPQPKCFQPMAEHQGFSQGVTGMNRPAILSAILLSAFGVAAHTQAPVQTATATKEPTAAVLAINALNAMGPSVALNDITLSAQVIRTVGSRSESGAAILEATSSGQTSLTYSLGHQQRTEIVNPSSDPRGVWTDADGAWHSMATHNTWTPTAWFAPALVLKAALDDPQLVLENLGPMKLNDAAVVHLRSSRTLPSTSGGPATLAMIRRLSAVDIYLDATSNLPVELDFDLHPNSNAGVDIPVAVRFSDWRQSAGAMLPFHIQKFLNGSLLDDISVSSIDLNRGLSPSSFTVPATSGGAQ